MIALVKHKSNSGESYARIGRELSLSKSTIHYMVRNDYHRAKKKTGRPEKLSKRDKNAISTEIQILQQQGERVTSMKLVRNCSLQASDSTVRRYLTRSKLRHSLEDNGGHPVSQQAQMHL